MKWIMNKINLVEWKRENNIRYNHMGMWALITSLIGIKVLTKFTRYEGHLYVYAGIHDFLFAKRKHHESGPWKNWRGVRLLDFISINKGLIAPNTNWVGIGKA